MSSASPDPAPSRRERRRREVHEQIVDAALRLFEEKGFAATTALEIAEAADVAEKTFYNHFETKQQLIAEIAQRKFGAMAGLLAQAHACPGTTEERLRVFCEGVADLAERSRVFTREILFEVVRGAQMEGLFIDRHRGVHRAIQTLFKGGRSGDAAGGDAGIVSELGVAAFIGIILNWVTIPNYPLRERLRQLADVASELIASRATATSHEAPS